jgi:hypothetical protein
MKNFSRSLTPGQIGVDLSGVLEKRYNSGRTGGKLKLPGRAVGFQSLKRWRCCLCERGIVLVHCTERFANAGSELTRNVAEDVQHIFFSCCLHLFLIENVSRSAIPCPQAQHVLATETCDRAFQDSGARRALTDKSRVHRLAHQTQHTISAFFRDKAQKGRLLKAAPPGLAAACRRYIGVCPCRCEGLLSLALKRQKMRVLRMK